MDLSSLPEDFLREAVRLIHHSSSDEKELAKSLAQRLSGKFFKNERIVITNKNGDRPGVITNIVRGESPSNKENECRYSVTTDQGQVEEVPSSMLRRGKQITESDLADLVAECATRKAASTPWIVNSDLRTKYDVKDKVHPLFLNSPVMSPKPGTSDAGPKNSVSSQSSSAPDSKRAKLANGANSKSKSTAGASTSAVADTDDVVCLTPSTSNAATKAEKKAVSRSSSSSSFGFPECEVVLERRSTGIAPSSYAAKKAGQLHKRKSTDKSEKPDKQKVKTKKEKPDKPKKEKSDKPKKEKADKPPKDKEKKKKDTADGEGKSKKAKAPKADGTPKKKTPSTSGDKNDGGEKPVKKKKQQELSQFFSPSSTSSGSQPLTQEERQAKRLKSMVDRILRNLRQFDHEALAASVTIAAKALTNKALDKVDNDFVKYIIEKKVVQVNNQEKMKGLSAEEKKKLRTEGGLEKMDLDPYYENILTMFASGKREDTLLSGKGLPKLTPVDTGSATIEFFGRCLHLTEFLNSFRPLLNYGSYFSAQDLISATYDGWNGFSTVTGPILRVLVEFLITDGLKSKLKIPELNCHLRQFTTEVEGISELTKMLLLEHMSSQEGPQSASQNGDENGEEQVPEEEDADESHSPLSVQLHGQELVDVAERFKDVDFHELLPSDQMALLEYLVETIQSRDQWRAFMEDGSGVGSLMAEKKALEAKLADYKTRIAALPTHQPTEEELLGLTRKQSQELSEKFKQRARLADKIEDLKADIEKKEQEIKDAKLISRARVVPLGYDRFHRRYWFFPNSANSGIYIEQGYLPESAVLPADENEVSKEAKHSESLEEFLHWMQYCLEGRPPKSVGSVRWWRLGSVEELNELLENLYRKGLREEALRARIESLRDYVVKSFTFTGKAEVQQDSEIPKTPLEGLKKSVLSMEEALREGLFSNIKDFEKYRRDVEDAGDLNQMKDLIRQLVQSLPEQAIRKPQSFEWHFNLERWMNVLQSARTSSQNYLLLDLLEQFIDWHNALSKKKCRMCRKTGSHEKPIALCKCGAVYHLECHKPTIDEEDKDNWKCKMCMQEERRKEKEREKEEREEEYEDEENSASSHDDDDLYSSGEDEEDGYFDRRGRPLRQVRRNVSSMKNKLRSPPIDPKLLKKLENRIRELENSGRVYPTLTTADSYHGGTTLASIKTNLKKFKSVAALDDALKQNVEDALEYYENNERKLTMLTEFKSVFFVD